MTAFGKKGEVSSMMVMIVRSGNDRAKSVPLKEIHDVSESH